MSIENGQRFIRLLESKPELRDAFRVEPRENFETFSAQAGASCSTWEVVAALIRNLEQNP